MSETSNKIVFFGALMFLLFLLIDFEGLIFKAGKTVFRWVGRCFEFWEIELS